MIHLIYKLSIIDQNSAKLLSFLARKAWWSLLFQETHPVDEDGLDELDDLECDLQADGDEVVEQDDERQQVVPEVRRLQLCNHKQHH